MNRFFLIRHAATDSVGKKLSGRSAGVYINEEGKRQARELVSRLSNVHIDAIYSSPMERSVHSAHPLAEARRMQLQIMPAFNEIECGEWTNKSLDELSNDPVFTLFNQFRSQVRIPGGEMMSEAMLRMLNGMEKLNGEYNNSHIVIFSHADMIRATLSWYLGMPLDLLQRLEVGPASISIIELFAETSRVILLNHLGDIKM